MLMPSVYPALDGDTPDDAWQRIQDAANGLHLHVYAVHTVHRGGGPAQWIWSGMKVKGVSHIK